MTDGYKIKRVLIRPNGTEKQIYPAGWNPGSNTVAYYKFDGNLNDSSGNNHPCTVARGSAVYNTVSGTNQAITASGNVIKSGVQQQDILTANHTLSFWIDQTSINGLGDARVMGALGASGAITHIGIGINGTNGLGYCFYFWQPNKSGNYTKYSYTFALNTWYNIVLTIDNSLGCSCYVNGVQAGTTQTIANSGTSDFYFGNNYQLGDSSYMYGYLDDIIIESKVWSASDVANYYNQTKGNYGL